MNLSARTAVGTPRPFKTGRPSSIHSFAGNALRMLLRRSTRVHVEPLGTRCCDLCESRSTHALRPSSGTTSPPAALRRGVSLRKSDAAGLGTNTFGPSTRTEGCSWACLGSVRPRRMDRPGLSVQCRFCVPRLVYLGSVRVAILANTPDRCRVAPQHAGIVAR